MTQVLSPAAIDGEISRLCSKLEAETETYADMIRNAAEAEVNYKREFAKVLLRTSGTVAERDAESTLAVADKLMERRLSEAIAGAQKELLATLRAELSALQTLAANLREQVR